MVKEELPVCWVRYYDHEWLEDHKELSEILLKKAAKVHGFIITEVGMLLADDPLCIIIAMTRDEDRGGDKPRITYSEVSRIMKSDIIAIKKFTV